jgi:hypothetical protein
MALSNLQKWLQFYGNEFSFVDFRVYEEVSNM